ncbi:MAG: glycosyltransferase family 2 protein [Cyclobacteriaceae bacterium]|nr:glycosyltransferase family 2 protein [Cyclobacteriaceae bacterium]
MSHPLKDIAVVLVNYNTSEYTLQCINSIVSQVSPKLNYSIIVVDNNSRQEELKKLEALEGMDTVAIIKLPMNSGFSSANKAGMEITSARYYYFLNNDTELENDALDILYEFMEKHPEAGISSGQMYHADGSIGININYFPDLWLKFLGSGFLRVFSPGKYPKKGIPYVAPVKVPLLNGSSLFIRKKALDEAGGFDTEFFLYCEEEDLALRMKKKGYACYLVPEARYTHYEGKSSIRDEGINYLMLREFYISQHYLYQKHYGRFAAFVWRVSQFFRTFRKCYIHQDYVKLAFFILWHPNKKYSLRHQQTIR